MTGIMSPIPLSVLAHAIFLLLLALMGSIYGLEKDLQSEPISEVIVYEITPEEAIKLAEEHPIEEYTEVVLPEPDPAFTMFVPDYTEKLEPSISQEIIEDIVKEIVPEPPVPSAGAVENIVVQQAAEGTQAPLAADAAVETGDGAVAAGKGNPSIAEGGSSFAQDKSGTGTGDTQGADNNISTGNTMAEASNLIEEEEEEEYTESLNSIADRFAARVDANKKYPYMAMKRNQQGVVYAYAVLSEDGSLEECGISSSSGVDSLDNAAVQAVENSCPFTHGGGSTVSITVPIHFELY